MVWLKVKFKNGKTVRQWHDTVASAKKTQKFVGKVGKTEIVTLRKINPKKKSRGMFDLPF